MSLATDIIGDAVGGQGANLLGETVGYRGQVMVGVFDRRQMTEINGKLRIKATSGATIILPMSINRPEESSVITDSRGEGYTINRVRWLGYGWQCECESVESIRQ